MIVDGHVSLRDSEPEVSIPEERRTVKLKKILSCKLTGEHHPLIAKGRPDISDVVVELVLPVPEVSNYRLAALERPSVCQQVTLLPQPSQTANRWGRS